MYPILYQLGVTVVSPRIIPIAETTFIDTMVDIMCLLYYGLVR